MEVATPMKVLESMIEKCCFQEAKIACQICQVLKAKMEILKEGKFQYPTEENSFVMEQDQGQILIQQFIDKAKSKRTSERTDSGAPSNATQDLRQQTDPKSTGGAKETDATIWDFAADSQRIDDPPDAIDKNISLSYGLHDLIRDIEQNPNYHAVFEGLSQAQLRSLYAQITSKETLINEDRGADNAAATLRLVRIEQELNDLMVKDEASTAVMDASSGGASGVKKSNHDHAY